MRHTAHLFQRRICEKAYEVRLTVVGDEFFATRIDASSAAARADWRADYDSLTYTTITTPDDVRSEVTELLRRLDLRFAALDFVVSPDETWRFLEANPNGQWGFIEHHTGYPIAATLATELLKGRP